MEYDKDSFLRLEKENLLQPIDLADVSLATIFLQIQLEQVRRRVSQPVLSHEIKTYPWGKGVEIVYRWRGGEDQLYKVVEVSTTYGSTLFRLTYCVKEEDEKSERVLSAVVDRFRPFESSVATPDSGTAPAIAESKEVADKDDARLAYRRFSVEGAERAAIVYRHAAQSESSAEAYAGLAEALGWKAYLEQEITPAALHEMTRAAQQARQIDPERNDTQRAVAYAAYHSNRMIDMETAIAESLRIDPRDAETLLLQAIWYEFDPEKSRLLAEEALAQEPDLMAGLIVKARAARREGHVEAAVAALEQVVSKEPGLAWAWVELAEIAEERGDAATALTRYRAAVRADPERTEFLFRLAVLLRRAGRVDEAIQEYSRLLEIAPDRPEVHYNLALVYLQDKNEPEIASHYFSKFLELDPESDKAEQARTWMQARGHTMRGGAGRSDPVPR
jgi:tetratricopeptide (TPR) repeat protein